MRRLLPLLIAAVALFGTAALTGSAADESDGVFNCSEGRVHAVPSPSTRSATGRVHRARRAVAAVLLEHSGRGKLEPLPAPDPERPGRCRSRTATAATWNFQLHPAFWLGMALCDNQSAPEFTHAPCTPDSDSNIFDGTEPGRARLHRQAPRHGVPRGAVLSAGLGALAARRELRREEVVRRDGDLQPVQDQNAGVLNNADCRTPSGDEPANFAFITQSGVPHAPPSPLDRDRRDVHAERVDRLFMDSGDQLTVDIHDGAGRADGDRQRRDERTDRLHDGQRRQRLRAGELPADGGDLPASRRTRSARCTRPRASTPASRGPRTATTSRSRTRSATSSTATSVPARAATAPRNTEASLDDDDTAASARPSRCRSRSEVASPPTATSTGPRTSMNWPGTGEARTKNPTSIRFTSPLFNMTTNYSRVAFEADLPRIEAAGLRRDLRPVHRGELQQPATGAHFYPIYSTAPRRRTSGSRTAPKNKAEGCAWQLGGTGMKDTTNTFGGNSTNEYGPLLFSFYPTRTRRRGCVRTTSATS